MMHVFSGWWSLVLVSGLLLQPGNAFWVTRQPAWATPLFGNNDENKNGAGEKNNKNNNKYQFGDISRGILGKVRQDVNSLTGKSTYEFGDLSRWLDLKSKEGVTALDGVAKQRVQDFTKKSNYQFGDITQELVRRLKAGEYTAEDVWLFLKIAGIIGINMQPIAAVLPAKVVMELLEVSIAQSLGDKIVTTLSTEVDQRMKHWITGDKDYRLGDITRKNLMGDKDYRLGDITKKTLMGDKNYQFGDLAKRAVSKFTGKDSYAFGDLTQKLLWEQEPSSESKNKNGKKTNLLNMDDETQEEFEKWDKVFLETQTTDPAKVQEQQFKAWDEQYLAASKSNTSDNNDKPF
jgi:hypothetical protein